LCRRWFAGYAAAKLIHAVRSFALKLPGRIVLAMVVSGSVLFGADFPARPADWFRSAEGREAIGNVLSWQTEIGSWPKNIDTSKPRHEQAASGTFDNGATTRELRFLAQAYSATGDPSVKVAFIKGLKDILASQYPNGGWPQRFPPGKGYHRYVTFNDDVMVRLLRLLRDISKREDFAFAGPDLRTKCREAFDRGIECILKAQIKVNGELTVWCAQHDEKTLEPRPARTFELVSLSGSESAGILKLLMSLEHPSPEARQSIRAGVAWFEKVKLTGIRQTKVDGDKRIVMDSDAPIEFGRKNALQARFSFQF
jgi:PelA/Pel-15E family pectate lyase